MRKKVLIFAGISGGGKTYVTNLLADKFPEEFKSLKQVTTRPMREDESQGQPYIFIDKEEYDNISHKLVGKTEIHGNYYGTLFECDEDKFNTIILNKKGLDDFKEEFPLGETDVDYIVVMIDSKKPIERKDRGPEYLANERWSIMPEMNICFVQDPPYYMDINEIKEKIITLFNRFFKTN